MSTFDELTIVIPAKNEERLIGQLLESICRQNYPYLSQTRVIIADAASTDATIETALRFKGRLKIEITTGGIPAEGRNNGAALARSTYLLFLDADIELGDRGLIKRALEKMKKHQLHCATTFISSKEGSLSDSIMYAGNSIIQLGSKFSKPFSPGAFMLFEKKRFDELGGFDEKVLYAEDYFLTRNIARKRFSVVPGFVRTTNRRFQKMGRVKFIKLFFKTVVNKGNEAYFYQDHQYW